MATSYSIPKVLGCQFTSEAWVRKLEEQSIKISMTGKGRCLDNIYIERFWRSFKQEEFYLNDYVTVKALRKATHGYIEFYNYQRPHQSLNYKTPAEVYFSNIINLTTMRLKSPKNNFSGGLDIGAS